MTTKIIGTGSYVPAQIVTNDDLSKIVETNDQWIRSRTGIGERRIATDDSTSDMAAKAAARAIEQAGIDPEEIDLIILATSSPDYCFPNGACEVQAKVGAVNAACFDISSACTGFVFALSTAHAYISSGLYKTALVIGADLLSKLVDWTDRSTCVLFGDGAGAAVVTAAENGIIGLNMHSNGAKGGVLRKPFYGKLLIRKETGAWLHDHGRTGSVQICCKAGSRVYQRSFGRNRKYSRRY